jgi:hypothetical protein
MTRCAQRPEKELAIPIAAGLVADGFEQYPKQP